MGAIGAQKLALPCLTPAALWRRTGRWEAAGDELFTLRDRADTELLLGPTHEETITSLVATLGPSLAQLPLLLYQLDRKFRDEVRPRYGLLRAREFLMKDLYTFHATKECALQTYADVCSAYEVVARRLSLPVRRVEADPGLIGGSLSHEYVVEADVGEDQLYTCEACGYCSKEQGCGGDASACRQAAAPVIEVRRGPVVRGGCTVLAGSLQTPETRPGWEYPYPK